MAIASLLGLAAYLHNYDLAVSLLGAAALIGCILVYLDVAHERGRFPFKKRHLPASPSPPPLFTPQEARQIADAARTARELQRHYWLDLAAFMRYWSPILSPKRPKDGGTQPPPPPVNES